MQPWQNCIMMHVSRHHTLAMPWRRQSWSFPSVTALFPDGMRREFGTKHHRVGRVPPTPPRTRRPSKPEPKCVFALDTKNETAFLRPSDVYQRKARQLFPKNNRSEYLGTQNDQLVPGRAESSRTEVAIVGRSNCGKSTLINTLLNKHELCPTSKNPGRTRTLNFFRVNQSRLVLVDLPGYGHASSLPQTVKDAWMQLISGYIFERSGNPPPSAQDSQGLYPRILRRVLLLVDSRRGFTQLDEELMDMLDEVSAPYQIVLTKADTLSTSAGQHTLVEMIRSNLQQRRSVFPVINMVSSKEEWGIDQLKVAITSALPYDMVSS
eukprot:gb/GECG01007677.1/.p1 GENE.gb/GECG01007677.1/~~gb/GECG01007677.1/.p1  ORF type:complete len:322 (+),score=21.13 gb/GECG01007677.1/:1-966(+)